MHTGVVYASMKAAPGVEMNDLQAAVDALMSSSDFEDGTKVAWNLSYTSRSLSRREHVPNDNVSTFGSYPYDLAFDDSILEDVKKVWSAVMGSDAADSEFLRFEERNAQQGDEES
jgi:Rab proteins geranylgeranyltransferase component A